MQMRRLWLAQRNSVALHPRMRRKLLAILSNADAKLGRNALPRKQPPQAQRALKTS